MRCPTQEWLQRYAAETLSPAERHEVAAHLTACSQCADALKDMAPGDSVEQATVGYVETTTASSSTLPAIPGYEILAQIGRGGMGVVCKARHVGLNRMVAIKMLSGADATPDDVARLRLEAEALAQLQHPNHVQIFELGEDDGRVCFTMEFCSEGSLAAKLAVAPLPHRQAAALLETLGRAMHAAHERQIIHRDLKPGNILMADEGVAKIADFGLAK